MLTKNTKELIVKKFAKSEKDTGSCELQVALISARIQQISAHLKSFPKDNHSRRGLLGLVGQRNTFLKYLQRTNEAGHLALVAALKQEGYL